MGNNTNIQTHARTATLARISSLAAPHCIEVRVYLTFGLQNITFRLCVRGVDACLSLSLSLSLLSAEYPKYLG